MSAIKERFISSELRLPFRYSAKKGAEIGFEPINFEVTQYLDYQIAEGVGLEPTIYNIYNIIRLIVLRVYLFRHPSRVLYYIPL